MIEMEYIIDGKKSLLTIIFDKHVMNHFKAKIDDNINFFQSLINFKHFTLIKADTGYRITRVPLRKKNYKISIGFRLHLFKEFNLMQCSYFMKKNGSINIILKNAGLTNGN